MISYVDICKGLFNLNGEKMKRKYIVLSVTAILLFVTVMGRAQSAKPEVPFIQYDICPFECCQLGKWTARSVLKVFEKEVTIQECRSLFSLAKNLWQPAEMSISWN